jgi:uncharacterized protein YkwD
MGVLALIWFPGIAMALHGVHAAPPAAPRVIHSALVLAAAGPAPQTSLPLYSIGNPTDEEQDWLEMVNFERANPVAEAQILESATDPVVVAAYSFFDVNLTTMVSAFNAISPVPPLSMNADLITAATVHSQDMLAHTYQGHTGSDGSTPETRIAAQGYSASTDGENVFAFAASVFEGNVAFEVDWGDNPPSGMQDPPGHRDNDHDGAYAEVGIGIIDGTAEASGTEFGPIICTMDFGTQKTYTPFVTGVVYYDVNGNGMYDMGEGLGGVAVNVSGASYSASTANSGGYSVPVAGAGNKTVTFSVSGMADEQVSVKMTGTSNVKVDLNLPYTPPVISGPPNPPVNQQTTYQFTPLPGATSYQFQQSQIVPFTTVETGLSGTGDFAVTTTGTYSVIASDEPFNGAASFHLAHQTEDGQALELNFPLLPGPSSMLEFESLLGYATNTEIASAEVSTDGGASWQAVWTEAGSNGSGDTSFSAQSVSLAAYAGQSILVRFAYDASGGFYPEVATGVGFYVDDIQVTDASEFTDTMVTAVTSGTSFNFEPSVTGSFALAVRAQAVSRYFPYGPEDVVIAGGAAGSAPEAVTESASGIGVAGATLNGTVNPNGGATTGYFQWGLTTSYGHNTSATSLGSSTSPLAVSANLTTLSPGTKYHYRIVAANVSGTTNGLDEVFTTTASTANAPIITTNPATDVTAATATLNGSVNPNGLNTSVWFQFGLTTAYSSRATAISAGDGTAVLYATCPLAGLQPDTTYHFRMSGSNASGLTSGSDQTFTTGSGISFPGLQGKYVGLIATNPVSNATSGILALTLGAKGQYTASGKLGGKSFALPSRFDANGDSTLDFATGLQLQLQLVSQPAAVVTGSVNYDGGSSGITLEPVVTAAIPAAFTFQLPAPAGTGLPQGNGYGTIKLRAGSSAAAFSGKLGDGTAIAYGGAVVTNGTEAMLPVYIPLYGAKGSISGMLTRNPALPAEISGTLNWFKPQTTGTFLPDAFATPVEMEGLEYVKPGPNQRAIALTSGTVTFDSGGLATSPGADKLKMSINASTGLFSGSFVNPGTGKSTSFSGALFQGPLNNGTGLFKGKTEAGSVELQQ